MRFVESSVIVASALEHHPSHEAAIDCLAKLDAKGGACALHSLSEVFAILTRLPLPARFSADSALQLVRHTAKRYKLLSLSPAEHLEAITTFVGRGLTGAMVYDALILQCARKIQATHIYTLNLKHFRLVAPDLADRILAP